MSSKIVFFASISFLVMVTGCKTTDKHPLREAPRGAEFISVDDGSRPNAKPDVRMVAKMDEVEDYTLDGDSSPTQKTKKAAKNSKTRYSQSWDY